MDGKFYGKQNRQACFYTSESATFAFYTCGLFHRLFDDFVMLCLLYLISKTMSQVPFGGAGDILFAS